MERGCPFGGYYGSIGQQGWCGRGGAAGCGEICLGGRRDRPWRLGVGGEGRAEPRAGALAAGWAVVPWSRAIGRDRGFLLPPALPFGGGGRVRFSRTVSVCFRYRYKAGLKNELGSVPPVPFSG